ncbi:hypothetical protein [Tessaracoccus antarcticus]|uniref:hypothetical protein n=1 Tax=Tessaracoccus antarcticus TaxID=2479848 RepID=UPI0018F44257|nr:hypothetical protein [Tessaracoccus antarcticus]
MDSTVVLRNIGNVANLSTPLGLLVAIGGRGRFTVVDGLLVAESVTLRGVTASAMTIGSVVLVPRQTLAEARARIPGLLEHEGRHAHQWAYCLGLPFIAAYGVATGWSWLRSGDRATVNVFEMQAGLALGGYPSRETRPLGEGVRALVAAAGALVSGAGARRSGRPAAASAADAGV